jgi:hypothetical protein
MFLKIILSILFIIISLPFIIFGIRSKQNIYANIGTIFLITSLIILVIPFSKESIYKDYLTKVYPAMDQNKSAKDYENLYHSLGWYYQCCNMNHTNIEYIQGKWSINGEKAIGSNGEEAQLLRYVPSMAQQKTFTMANFDNKNLPTWDKLPCCVDKYKLPAIPRGNLYDWWSLQYFNVPTITVNKHEKWKFANTSNYSNNRSIDTFISQSPYTTFQGYKVFDDNNNSAAITPSDPLGQNTNNIPVGLWAGPGPFYGGARAIIKSIYFPNCPHFNYTCLKWSLYNTYDTKKWLTTYLTPDKLPMKDSNLHKQWVYGFNEGDYMELTHIEQTPGMVQSTGYWLNYLGSGGTGVFYKVGNTPKVSKDAVEEMKKYVPEASVLEGCSPRNKAHVLFTLLWEVKNTKKLPKPAGSYWFTQTYENGSDLLKAFYGTDDPWYITMWYTNGWAPKNANSGWSDYDPKKRRQGTSYTPLGKEIKDWAVDRKGNTFVNPLFWASAPWMTSNSGGPNTKFITRQVGPNFSASILNLGDELVNISNKIYLNSFYGVMDNNNGVLYATICAFLLSIEFANDPLNYAKYIEDPKTYKDGTYNTQPNLYTGTDRPVGTVTMEGIKYSLTKHFMGNWFFDRASNGVAYDEPINYFGSVLGYEFIQMPCNVNTSGMWCYECIYLGLPQKSDNLGLKSDDEAFNWHDNLITKRQYSMIEKNSTYGPSYLGPAVAIMNKLLSTKLSQRDPFNLDNAIPCYNLGGIDCKNTPGVTCIKGSAILDDTFKGYYKGNCTVDNNIGMTDNINPKNGVPFTTTGSVLWDPNGFCHIPWGVKDFDKNGGQKWGQASANGHLFCQAPGSSPTFSSIWSNVIYGGRGYGTGIVPLKSELLKNKK